MRWRNVKLGDTCNVIAGGTPKRSKPSYWNGDIPWVKISDMLEGRIRQTEETITRAGLEGSSAKLLPPGTLLVSIFATIGRTAVLECEAATNQAIVGVIPRQQRQFDDRFLQYSLRRKTQQLQRQGRGVAQANINGSVLRATELPLPPFAEQKRLAGILDAADALRAKRREALAQLDTLLQSTFLDMFGDPVTNPMGWTKVRSGELFLLPPKIGTITPAAGRGYLVVRVGEVGESRIAFERCGRVEISEKDFAKFRLERGDTVIARAIGSKNHLGKASFFADFDEATVIDSHVMRLRPDPIKCDGLWFYSLISSDRGKALLQQTGGATAVQFNINAKQASSVQVALPPLDLQHYFAAIAESVEHQKAVQRAHLAELDTLFASLQSRAFRGDL